MDKALLIGINAYQGCPLNGCINDISDMANYLVKRGFKQENVSMLADGRATTQSIYDRLAWLVTGCQAGDRIFFHYSGHGAQAPTHTSTLELDGMDEVICPVDFDWSPQRMITDKQFKQIFTNIPAGVKFTWVSDSCHSGDLTKGIGHPNTKERNFPVPLDIQWQLNAVKQKGIKARGLVNNVLDVGYVSGCQDNQTSADAYFGGRYNGALTHFLLQILNSLPVNTPLTQVVAEVNKLLIGNNYSQRPQAEGARRDKPFLE